MFLVFKYEKNGTSFIENITLKDKTAVAFYYSPDDPQICSQKSEIVKDYVKSLRGKLLSLGYAGDNEDSTDDEMDDTFEMHKVLNTNINAPTKMATTSENVEYMVS